MANIGAAEGGVDFAMLADAGSLLADFGPDVGAILTLESSTFNGNFGETWTAGNAKGEACAVAVQQPSPGTGTIGYWKNHPEAWPASNLIIGGVNYSQNELISILKTPTRGDKTVAMAKQLIGAKLNVLLGNESGCIDDTIAASDSWLAAHGGIGTGQRQWDEGDLLHDDLDAYNNGLLCAPHRD